MSRQHTDMIHLCSFTTGLYRAQSAGGRVVNFEDTSYFGPFLLDRKGEPHEFPAKHWFWRFYDDWTRAGKPTQGPPISTPFGELQHAVWPPSPGSDR
jgi:hypothetical protein